MKLLLGAVDVEFQPARAVVGGVYREEEVVDCIFAYGEGAGPDYFAVGAGAARDSVFYDEVEGVVEVNVERDVLLRSDLFIPFLPARRALAGLWEWLFWDGKPLEYHQPVVRFFETEVVPDEIRLSLHGLPVPTPSPISPSARVTTTTQVKMTYSAIPGQSFDLSPPEMRITVVM